MNEYEERLLAHLEHHGELLEISARASKEVGIREKVREVTERFQTKLKGITDYWHHRL
jgi:hypothetical protein